jgi:ribose/xylose/arabinose/galactoside ABC-type transport system permease subunit
MLAAASRDQGLALPEAWRPGVLLRRRARRWLGLLVVLLLVAAAIQLIAPSFYRSDNLFHLLRQAAILGIVALGQTMVLLVAGIDLSVGAVIGLSLVTLAEFGRGPNPPLLPAILAVLLLGAGVGCVNGLLVTLRNVPPFIATLGMGVLIEGARLFYTHGVPSGDIPRALRPLGLDGLGLIPYAFLLWVVLAALVSFALERMTFGRALYATGTNREAARLAGLPINRVVVSAYVLCGLFAAIAGLVLSAYVGYVDRYLGLGFDLDSIAAVVVGGTSFAGGRGGVPGTILGVFFVTLLLNLAVLLALNPQIQLIIKGVLIAGAVGIWGLVRRDHA